MEWARQSPAPSWNAWSTGYAAPSVSTKDAADPQAAAWRDEARVFYDEDGTLVIRLRLTAADGALVLAALEHARAALDHEHQPAHEAIRDASDSSAEDPPPPAASAAEGFVHLSRIGLEAMATTRPETARRHRSRLTAHIDPLSGWGRLADGELLPPGSMPVLGPAMAATAVGR